MAKYTFISKDNPLNFNNINNRIFIPKDLNLKYPNLVKINIEKLDKILSIDPYFYIRPQQNISNLYNYHRAFEYLKTGNEINAPILLLFEEDNKINAGFLDGRHRYSVMRDLGMKQIKLAMNNDTLAIAKKYGLLT